MLLKPLTLADLSSGKLVFAPFEGVLSRAEFNPNRGTIQFQDGTESIGQITFVGCYAY